MKDTKESSDTATTMQKEILHAKIKALLKEYHQLKKENEEGSPAMEKELDMLDEIIQLWKKEIEEGSPAMEKELDLLDESIQLRKKEIEEVNKRNELLEKKIEELSKNCLLYVYSRKKKGSDEREFCIPKLHYDDWHVSWSFTNGIDLFFLNTLTKEQKKDECDKMLKAEILKMANPLADLQFKASEFPFLNQGCTLGPIASFRDIGDRGLMYHNVAGIRRNVHQMLVDALTCAGLDNLFSPSFEISFFSDRPDFLVLRYNKAPKHFLMCIEVKSPVNEGREVFSSKEIAFQVYSHLMHMKQQGQSDPVACLSTYDRICMASIDNPAAFDDDEREKKHKEHLASIKDVTTGNQFIEEIEINDPELPPLNFTSNDSSDTETATGTASFGSINKSDTTKRGNSTEIATQVFYAPLLKDGDVFPNLVSMLLLAYHRSKSENFAMEIPLSQKLQECYKEDISRRIFPLVNESCMTFHKIDENCEVEYTLEEEKEIDANTKDFLWLETLGFGSSGKVFLACSSSSKAEESFGIVCAIKFYFQNERSKKVAEQIRDREYDVWEKLYGSEGNKLYDGWIKKRTINGRHALLLPYGKSILVNERNDVLEDVRKILLEFAEKGYMYVEKDLSWRHVLRDAKDRVFLTDLKSLTTDDTSHLDQDEVVKKQMEGLESRIEYGV